MSRPKHKPGPTPHRRKRTHRYRFLLKCTSEAPVDRHFLRNLLAGILRDFGMYSLEKPSRYITVSVRLASAYGLEHHIREAVARSGRACRR